MTFRLLLPTVLVSLAAASASAQCPTASDLDRGIRVTFDNDDMTTFRRLPSGQIEGYDIYPSIDLGTRYLADWGIYSLEEIELSGDGTDVPNTRIIYTYGEAFPVPAADTAAHAGIRQVDEFGLATYSENWRVSFGAMDPVTIAGCRYDSVAVGIRLREGRSNQKDQFLYYLTDLGVGFIVSWIDGDGLHETAMIRIETVP